MTINITTWTPDTCGCQIHYAWDDSVPAEERIHSPVEGVTAHGGTFIPTKRCQHHEHHKDTRAHHDAVLEENQRKNKLHAHVMECFPELTRIDDRGITHLKEDALSWSYDTERALNVTIHGVAAEHKTAYQKKADIHLGRGKVIIN